MPGKKECWKKKKEGDLLRKMILILDMLWLKSTGCPGGRCIYRVAGKLEMEKNAQE